MSTWVGALRTATRWSLTRTVVRRLPWSATVAMGVLVVLGLATALADVVRPLDSYTVDFQKSLRPPTWAHPLGTDDLGRDVLARVLHGLRVSFLVGVLASLVALGIGGVVGITAGTLGGRVDAVLMRFLDMFASQNHLLFGIILAVLFRPAFGPMGAVLLSVGLTHWTTLARIVRGELLSLRERLFIRAAVQNGAGRLHLARRHYIPHLLPALVLGFVLLVPHAVFHESALSFLGVGLSPHQASLGNILADSRRTLLVGAWWTTVFPGLALFLVSMAIGVVGEYWRDRHNPRWRSELEL
ncbi:MAG: ABC transporter permease [Dehalococcoidia bacterium]|nr:ABC transporter permease [Dehalococcoidia bacterium]MDW8119711.1 ABC transporter permease [Chloroflexota bacterium]